MKKENYILTYDIGTTGNKCTLFDERGVQRHAVVRNYRTWYPKPGWAEQKAEDFWTSVVEGTRSLMERSKVDPSCIAVIGLSGHMNGCIPVDREGTALFNDIIHSDCRSFRECEEIQRVFDEEDFFRITGNRIDPHYTLPKIMWLRNQYADLYSRTAYFLNSKDYISFKLTGCLGITDYSDASLTCMLDIKNKRWSSDVVRGLGIDEGKLPEIRRSIDMAGYLTQESASLLGLKEGIPVVVGGGDGACASKGAGLLENGLAYNYIGSSSWISVLHEEPVMDSRLFNYYDLDGEHCNVCGTVQSATISYDWVVEQVGKYEVEKSKVDQEDIYTLIESMARQSPPGSNGVFFLPYLMGERTPLWDKNTRGAFIGFTLFNQRNDLFRAVYEGIAYALRSVIDCMEENRLFIDDLTLIGGGAKSPLWNEIMSNVYHKPLKIHKHPGEATSLGSAIAAGVGAGMFNTFKDATSAIEYDRTYHPDPNQAVQYDRYYAIYKMMYPSLKPVYDEMAKLSQADGY